MKSLLKTCTVARRVNAQQASPLPEEMLPKMNRRCGKWGHRWDYLLSGMKVCTNYMCEVRRTYTPNPHGLR